MRAYALVAVAVSIAMMGHGVHRVEDRILTSVFWPIAVLMVVSEIPMNSYEPKETSQ